MGTTSGYIEFGVRPGRVYCLTLVLQQKSAPSDAEKGGRRLGQVPLNLRCLDAGGQVLDPRLEAGRPIPPQPEAAEVLPPGPLTAGLSEAGQMVLLLLASPDAATLEVSGWDDRTTLHTAQLDEVPPTALDTAREALLAGAEVRKTAILDHLPDTDPALIAAVHERPLQQLDALAAYFSPGGDWEAVLDQLEQEDDLDADRRIRLARLRNQTEQGLRIGFIGSPRGRERLEGFAEILWLREAEWPAQLEFLALDLIVIEAVAASGASDLVADWKQGFSSLDGTLPAKGAELLAAARQAGIPVHLWATGTPSEAHFWRDAAKTVTRVIAEGPGEDWSLLTPDHILPRGTEPAVCSLASPIPRPRDLMLVPTGADIAQDTEFAEFVNTGGLYATGIADFRYTLPMRNVRMRLDHPQITLIGSPDIAMQRRLLQSATIVLLPQQSLLPPDGLLALAMDAIGCGAIPVLYGAPPADHPLLQALDRVEIPADLITLQAQFRITWVFQRRLRALFQQVLRDHTHLAPHRAALLGLDPMGDGFDTPRISAVLVTHRPHLVRNCIETFRNQSWPETELILIFNTGTLPDDLPELRANEHVFALPPSCNLGECLNMGIAAATGRYWAKLDDDDHYSPHYLANIAAYFRASQADATGRQSVHYYLASSGMTCSGEALAADCFRLLGADGRVAGSTLAGDRRADLPAFSHADRVGSDSSWLRATLEKHRVFSGDCIDMIVHRDADEDQHTWRMPAGQNLLSGFLPRAADLARLIEKPAEDTRLSPDPAAPATRT